MRVVARRRRRDRRRGRHLPRRLASRRRVRARARARRTGASRAARADDRRPLAADGELRRRRRHDRALDGRARLRSTMPSTTILGSGSASTPATGSFRASTSPIRTVLDAAVADLDDRIGLDRLRCLHVNDTKAALGSNRDRHESIGRGLMGNGLATFLAHPAFQEPPCDPRDARARRGTARMPTSWHACARSTASSGLQWVQSHRSVEGVPSSELSCSSTWANTRKLGLATGISKNSGLRQPISSPRCS